MLDKAAVFQMVDQALDSAQRRNTIGKELALAAAMDEMGQRMRSHGFIRSYTETLAAGDRTATLRGENDDLRAIFALKLGTGEYQRVLEYTAPQEFLREHDDPNADAGRPDRFTVLVSDEGFPTIKLNCPLEVAETLTGYYHVRLSADNLAAGRSISAAVAGTLAYFFGTATPMGADYYRQFKDLIRLGREADSFTPEVSHEFRLSKQDRDIRSVQADVRRKRK